MSLQSNPQMPFPFPFFSQQKDDEGTVRIKENATNILVTVEIGGFIRDDFRITFQDQKLLINATRSSMDTRVFIGASASPRLNQKVFNRTVLIPQSIQSELITFNYEDGLLRIWLPKNHQNRPVSRWLARLKAMIRK